MKELNPFVVIDIWRKDNENPEGRHFAYMPRIMWWISGFTGIIGGYLIGSYRFDPECKKGCAYHLWDALKCWWHCSKPLI